jgi:predicted O-linked N-acetylglucosamine transferase (SPINDLY family)
MGAPFIDYLIADAVLIPPEFQGFYSEKIAYLPGSYQVNDSHREISSKTFSRAAVGLPENGFVFCCFNGNFKITPAIFDVWMRLLQQVEGSVLWLLDDNPLAVKHLREQAQARGVTTDRLVFAPRMPLPDHLARHRHADLFLDTIYCNAHTTASDALWAGLPVLTCPGETFPDRVAASVLTAVGLPELIAKSLAEYEAIALELARDPAALGKLKAKLASNRLTASLFDARLFARHIESAFVQMQARQESGLPADQVVVVA